MMSDELFSVDPKEKVIEKGMKLRKELLERLKERIEKEKNNPQREFDLEKGIDLFVLFSSIISYADSKHLGWPFNKDITNWDRLFRKKL